MSYWPLVDGVLEKAEATGVRSSVVVGRDLPSAVRVVRTLNRLGYRQLDDLARPSGAPDRAAVAVVGVDPEAVVVVADLVIQLGFDPVRIDALADTAMLQPETEIFAAYLSVT